MSVAFTPQAFVAKWRKVTLKESAAAKEHFLDLCQLIGHPTPAVAEAVLKKRTLTNLYNRRPTLLDIAHKKLDAAVFAAHAWPADLTDEEILARLPALNLVRAGVNPGSQRCVSDVL